MLFNFSVLYLNIELFYFMLFYCIIPYYFYYLFSIISLYSLFHIIYIILFIYLVIAHGKLFAIIEDLFIHFSTLQLNI